MKGKVSVFLMVSLVVSLCALTILAQAEEKKAQLFWVNEVVVYPSMVQEFEEAVKAQVAFFTKHKCPFPYYTYSTYDYHYIVMIAIKNYAEIDDIHKAFSEISKLAPDEYQKMEEMFTETYEYARSGVYSLNYDLSLFPEEEKEKAGEENFIFFDIHYFKTGKEKEVKKLMKEMIALAREKGATEAQSWYCYQGIMGAEAPVYYMTARAKDAIDFETQNAKMWELLGEEAGELYRKWTANLRKRDSKSGWYRPNLSYIPKEK